MELIYIHVLRYREWYSNGLCNMFWLLFSLKWSLWFVGMIFSLKFKLKTELFPLLLTLPCQDKDEHWLLFKLFVHRCWLDVGDVDCSKRLSDLLAFVLFCTAKLLSLNEFIVRQGVFAPWLHFVTWRGILTEPAKDNKKAKKFKLST